MTRFLRARKFDLVKAKAMIIATEKWRKSFGVDDIVEYAIIYLEPRFLAKTACFPETSTSLKPQK